MYCKGQCGFYPAVVHSVHSVHCKLSSVSCVRLTAGLRTNSERKFLSCEISKGIVINRYFVKLNHCIVAIINFMPSKKSVLKNFIRSFFFQRRCYGSHSLEQPSGTLNTYRLLKTCAPLDTWFFFFDDFQRMYKML